MTREVDLVSYLPPFMRDYKELTETLEAENPEFHLVWNAADGILKNRFISTADEYGISMFEKMLGIYPTEEERLESRRARVQNRWFNLTPYTIRVLCVKLAELLGGNHLFTIRPDFEEHYGLELTMYFLDEIRTEEAKHLLEGVVPQNIVTTLVYESAHEASIYQGAVMGEADIVEIRQRRV